MVRPAIPQSHASPHERSESVRTEIAVIKERLLWTDRALELQATEYERRLDLLNHAHEETRRVQVTYLPRDLYDKSHDMIVQRIDFLEKWKERQGGTMATADYIGRAMWALFGGLIIGAVTFLLTRAS